MAEPLEQSRVETARTPSGRRGVFLLVGVAVIMAVAATLLVVFVAVIFGFPKHVTTGATSPDRRYIATVYQQSWFPARNATSVSIRPSLSALYGRDAHDVFVIDGPQGVGLFWSGERELTIVCVACRYHMYVQHEERWRDIDIKVVPVDLPQ